MKKSLLLLVSFILTANIFARPFITDWQVIQGSTFTFGGSGTNYNIEWWDADNPNAVHNTIHVTSPGNTTFNIPTGVGNIRISVENDQPVNGGLTSFQNTYNSNYTLKKVVQWGDIHWTDIKNAFASLPEIQLTNVDGPDLSAVTDLSNMFYRVNITGGTDVLAKWNTVNIKNMSSTFARSYGSANIPDITGWNVSNVEDMSYMFYARQYFNQNISNWNTGKVKTMAHMLEWTETFDQPIGNWDVSNVEDMSYMFSEDYMFNQPLNWNTAKVKNMSRLFYYADNFNQSLASWNLSSVTDFSQIFVGSGIDCNNYSATLVGWANNAATPSNLTLNSSGWIYNYKGQYAGPGYVIYNAVAQPKRDYLINAKGWTISGDQYDPTCSVARVYPVDFTTFDATLKNGILTVNWVTASETNCKEFIIEASKDGNSFLPIATVTSLAKDGNSTTALNYSWKGSPNATAAVALVLAGLFSLLSISITGKKRWMAILATSACSIFLLHGCTKQDVTPVNKNETIFVRIKQVDIGGVPHYSKTVRAVVE